MEEPHWLKSLVADVTEAQRSWRLRCIQVEAELRAHKGGKAHPESEDDNTLDLLAEVLSLERHVAELETSIAQVEQDEQSSRAHATTLEAEVEDLQAKVLEAQTLESAAHEKVCLLAQERKQRLQRHEARVEALRGEVRELTRAAGLPAEDVEPPLGTGTPPPQLAHVASAAVVRVTAAVERLRNDVTNAHEQRERIQMAKEEMRTRRWDLIEIRARAAREAAQARAISSARQAVLGKLQGEASRLRLRGEKARKQQQAVLSQHTTELASARAFAATVEEQLRKLRQQQGKQLKVLRSETSSLQAEVDAHVATVEGSQAEILRLRQEQAELTGSEGRHIEQTQLLGEQADSLKAEEARLLQCAALKESETGAAAEALHAVRQSVDASLAGAKAAREETEELQRQQGILQEKLRLHELDLAQCREQLGACDDEDELERALEMELSQAREDLRAVNEQRAQLEEDVRLTQQGADRLVSLVREGLQRGAQLQGGQAELVKSLPNPKSPQTSAVSVEQAFAKAAKRAETLAALFESGPTPSQPSNRRTAGNISDKQPVGSGGVSGKLQNLLEVQASAGLEATLASLSESLTAEEEKAVQAARQRNDELQEYRRRKRELEQEMLRQKHTYEVACQTAESGLKELEAQLELLDREGDEGAQAVFAEFADLLNTHAAERKLQVDSLRGPDGSDQLESSSSASEEAEFDLEAQRLRLAELGKQIEVLAREDSELREAKAQLGDFISRAKAAPISPSSPSSPPMPPSEVEHAAPPAQKSSRKATIVSPPTGPSEHPAAPAQENPQKTASPVRLSPPQQIPVLRSVPGIPVHVPLQSHQLSHQTPPQAQLVSAQANHPSHVVIQGQRRYTVHSSGSTVVKHLSDSRTLMPRADGAITSGPLTHPVGSSGSLVPLQGHAGVASSPIYSPATAPRLAQALLLAPTSTTSSVVSMHGPSMAASAAPSPPTPAPVHRVGGEALRPESMRLVVNSGHSQASSVPIAGPSHVYTTWSPPIVSNLRQVGSRGGSHAEL